MPRSISHCVLISEPAVYERANAEGQRARRHGDLVPGTCRVGPTQGVAMRRSMPRSSNDPRGRPCDRTLCLRGLDRLSWQRHRHVGGVVGQADWMQPISGDLRRTPRQRLGIDSRSRRGYAHRPWLGFYRSAPSREPAKQMSKCARSIPRAPRDYCCHSTSAGSVKR